MSRQDFKDTKKAFKAAASTLEATIDEFHNTHDISKSKNNPPLIKHNSGVERKQVISKRAKGEIAIAEKKVGFDLTRLTMDCLMIDQGIGRRKSLSGQR